MRLYTEKHNNSIQSIIAVKKKKKVLFFESVLAIATTIRILIQTLKIDSKSDISSYIKDDVKDIKPSLDIKDTEIVNTIKIKAVTISIAVKKNLIGINKTEIKIILNILKHYSYLSGLFHKSILL